MKPISYTIPETGFLTSDDSHLNSTKTHAPRSFYEKYGKRAFDLAFAILILPIIVPFIAVLWLITKKDPGPGFYGHTRVGQNGKLFKCWKIRTMHVNSDEMLANFLASNPDAAAEWEEKFKLTNDPRISRMGQLLRKTSLDELPQIWNVIKGEMSFVGPRPVVSEELERYGSVKDSYLSVKPGITGNWQTSGRNEVSYQERILLEYAYVSEITLKRDISFILKTPLCSLQATGK